MKKRIKVLMSISLALVLMFGNGNNAYAETIVGAETTMTILQEGVTGEGIRYIIYEEPNLLQLATGVSPCIIVSTAKSISIAYEGRIIPPSTFYYSQYEDDMKTTMSGTLRLQGYSYDRWPYFPWSTKATYAGTLVGNL